MARKLGAPIFLGVFTVLAIVFLTGGADDNNDDLRETFQVDAVYYDSGHVEIYFSDKSENTSNVILAILGMDDVFQKEISGHEFIEIVPFPAPPKYGWATHPVVLDIWHDDFGQVQIKTEIRPNGEPAPPMIYSRQ